MRSAADPLSRWIESTGSPSIIHVIEGPRGDSFVFKEISAPESGTIITRQSPESVGLVIQKALTSNRVRTSRKAAFSKAAEEAIIFQPKDIEYSEWIGPARSLCLTISREFIERTFHCDIARFEQKISRQVSNRIGYLLRLMQFDAQSQSPTGCAVGEFATIKALELLLQSQHISVSFKSARGAANKVKKACEIIEERLCESITLADIAQEVGLSIRHMTRAFRSVVGCTPYQYIIDRRVDRAREMIVRGTMTLSDIAVCVGFASHAHMTATFRKRLAVPPSHFCDNLS